MEDVSVALCSSDIYVQPSLSEGLPNSLLEAMACGLPVVITRVGGMPEVVEDGVHGFVVSPGDVDGLVQALNKLLSDISLRQKMGAEGCARIQRELSLDSIADKYITQYNKLVNG
jgi:glycosyltransferase involved in cell wall biosynthesis